MDEKKKEKEVTCPECYGSGSVEDYATGTAIGVSLGMGYFPSRRMCYRCNGSGRIKERS